MSVRDPGYDPRSSRRRDGASRGGVGGGGGPIPRTWIGPAIVAGIVLVLLVGIGGSILAGGGIATPTAPAPTGSATTAGAGAGPASSDGDPQPSVAPGTSGAPTASADPAPASPSPTPGPTVTADVAVVPVTSFRSGRTGVKPADVAAIAGGGGTYKHLVLVEADADAILAALELDRAALGRRLVIVGSAAALRQHLAGNRADLGILRADDVDASVRALAWGGKALFGVDRVASLARWPLTASLTVPERSQPAYDPKTAWTLVAGGDILLDRGVKLAIDGSRAGTDFPFNGGTAEITGICRDCSPLGWDTPYTHRTGHAGVVRDLVQGADIAIANFENPAPDRWRFHDHGTTFSANPKTIAALADAGIDWVSMANNHIGDAGRNGILQTMDNLDDHGIAHSGAGRNTAEAHKASLIEVGDVTVGLLGYDMIAPGYWSGADTPGSARMTARALKRDIRAARKAGAEVVIVFPHWGVEYRAAPTPTQQRLGHAAIDAGADMVIGNHPHWVEAMEVYQGKPIWYALGNFVFDQTWSIPTMEGMTLEMTFRGKDLVQVRMRPHLILDRAQPNFLDPLGDGKAVLDQLFKASKGKLAW